MTATPSHRKAREQHTMTRRIRTVLASTVLAAGIGLGALSATPALAWGQVSISIAPGSAEQDRILRTGLGIYALVNGIQNGAITQNGTGNAAGLSQNGRDNLGIVHQDGNGHNGTVTQSGNGNAYGLFQFGTGTNAHVQQNGHGGSGLGFVFGW